MPTLDLSTLSLPTSSLPTSDLSITSLPISPASFEALAALGLGFAFAGLLASGFEWWLRRPIGFRLLQSGGIQAFASVPLLVFCGPVLIIRDTIRDCRDRARPFPFAFGASMLAATWSLLCGRVVFDLAQRLAGA